MSVVHILNKNRKKDKNNRQCSLLKMSIFLKVTVLLLLLAVVTHNFFFTKSIVIGGDVCNLQFLCHFFFSVNNTDVNKRTNYWGMRNLPTYKMRNDSGVWVKREIAKCKKRRWVKCENDMRKFSHFTH